MESIVLLIALVVLVLLGAPIGFTLVLLPTVYILFFNTDVPLNLIPTQMFDVLDSVTLTAIPFFMLTGELMSTGKITDRLVALSAAIIGRMRGSLAQVNILVSMFFAGMNGSVVADTATVGSLLIPAMVKRGYEPEFAAAITAVSATIGGIIPPSIAMVILANAGGLSVGALFAAGIIPGILIGAVLMIITYVLAVQRDYERSDEKFDFGRLFKATAQASFALIIPIVLIGAVVGGISGVVEAGAITAMVALILGAVVYRTVTWDSVVQAFIRAFRTSAIVFIIISAAGPFSWLLTTLGAIQMLNDWLLSYADQPLAFATALVVFIYIIGMVMDSAANIIVLGPVLISVCVQAGYPAEQAALICVVGFLFGTVTPPIGVAYFTAAAVARASLESVAVSMVPYLIALFLLLFSVILIPDLTMWLPKAWGFI
jgi:tripartite ATP-independent transporter DctM subunit